ncbi:MAG: helix-turn-helix domain-containing protein [Anaerovoracaceae bacterium]
MNQLQKEQISRLREDGLGYSKIARTLGLSENTVKSYCKRNNLGGHLAVSASNHDVSQAYCTQCGKPLEQIPGRKTKKFCSTTCCTAWWKAHPEQINQKAVYEFVCAHCGEKFTAYGNKGRKYCTHTCYIADRFGGMKAGELS